SPSPRRPSSPRPCAASRRSPGAGSPARRPGRLGPARPPSRIRLRSRGGRAGVAWRDATRLRAGRAIASADMTRAILPQDRIDPALRDKISRTHRDMVDEAAAAAAAHDVLVVGMKQNPFPRRARKALKEHGVPFHYLEYGSYFNTWRRRTALKMWTGWPTFPM